MMETLQRVEQEIVSSQILACAIESEEDQKRRDRKQTATEERRTTLPEALLRQHTPWEVCARGCRMAGICRPENEAVKLIQRITKWTLRATEARTDGRYA